MIMLKIVFLFLVLLTLPGSIFQASEAPVEATRVNNDGQWVLRLSVGETVFFRGDDENAYYANQANLIDEHVVFAGYIIVTEGMERTYDGFLIVTDTEGQIIMEKTYEGSVAEEVRSVNRIDEETLIVQLRKETSEPGFYRDRLHFYKAVVLDNTLSFERELKRVHRIGDLLYLSTRHQGDYSMAVGPKGLFMEVSGVTGIADGKTYQDAVTFQTLGETYLNGELLKGHQHTIDYPGHYVIDNGGKSLFIDIEPIIKGVENDAVYLEEISIEISKGHSFLNYDLYLSGKPITMPGYYELRVEGVNGYEKRIGFTLESAVSGIEDDAFYQEPRTISFIGDGFLNNHQVSSGIEINQSGVYRFEIEGENGYNRSYTFEIDIDDKGNKKRYMRMEFAVVTTALLIGGVAVFAIYRKR